MILQKTRPLTGRMPRRHLCRQRRSTVQSCVQAAAADQLLRCDGGSSALSRGLPAHRCRLLVRAVRCAVECCRHRVQQLGNSSSTPAHAMTSRAAGFNAKSLLIGGMNHSYIRAHHRHTPACLCRKLNTCMAWCWQVAMPMVLPTAERPHASAFAAALLPPLEGHPSMEDVFRWVPAQHEGIVSCVSTQSCQLLHCEFLHS